MTHTRGAIAAAPSRASQGVTALVAVAVLVAWTLWIAGGHLRASASAPVFDSRSANAVRPPLEPAATCTPTTEPDTMRVVDAADGSAVPGAELWLAPPGARQLAPERSHLVGRTGVDGALALPPAVPGEDRELVLRAGHYRAAVLPPVNSGEGLRVALRRAAQQRLRCTGPAGVPIAGARVTLSRSSAPRTTDAACGLPPGGDPRGAVYSVRTGEDGGAVLDGLTPGTYALQIQHDHFAPVAPRELLELEVPARPIHVEMMDLLGCVLTPPEGDFVETSGIRTPPGELRTTVQSMSAARRAQQSLRAANPGCFVHVLPGDRGVGTRRARGKALLRQLGFRVFDVELRPLRSLVPGVLDVRGPAQAWATVRIRTPQRSPLELLLRHDDGGVVCHVPLPLDQDVRVPAGDYGLDTAAAPIRALLPKGKLRLAADRTTDLPLDPGDWRVVHLRVVTPSNEPVGPCSVRVQRNGRHLHGFVARDGGEIALTVPAGKVGIVVGATGFVTGGLELEVRTDATPSNVTLPLDYGD
ncbi:MAG: carboxypeptidase-like regulatory domain-containing protein [Planctomycetota bacterium]